MAPVDDVLLKNGINYWRYMDDVMIVATTKPKALAGMRIFERECRRRGLIISSHKTELLSGTAALTAGSAPKRDFAQYLIDSRQEHKAKKGLRTILAESLKWEGNIDVGGATFSIWRLALLLDRTPIRRILSRLEDLGPVARVGAAYIRLFLSRPEVESALSAFLSDPAKNISPVTESWLFACMVGHPGSLPAGWITRSRTVAQDRNGLNYHRALAVNVMALAKHPPDIAWIKGELRRDYDPDMLRAYLVALARIGKLDRTTAGSAVARTPSLTATTSYLANRNSLPSLVWRGQNVRIE